MDISENFTLYLLLVSNAILVAAASIAVVRFRRQCLKLQHFWNSPTGAALADQSTRQDRSQSLANLRLEKRLTDLQRELQSLSSIRTTNVVATERNLPIDNAVRMVKNGASIEQLTSSCGLNIGEARLMHKMHSAVPPRESA